MEDPQAYIESGILEQYALGLLTPAEQAAVEVEAARHPAIAQELAAAQLALEHYAQAYARELPAGMRERVLANVRAQMAPAAAPVPSASLRAEADALARPQPAAGEAVVRPLAAASAPPTTRQSWAIAASVALLLSLLGNGWLYSRWQNADHALVAIKEDQNRLAANTLVAEKQLGDVRQQNSVLRDAEFRFVALAGTPAAPAAHARVLFNAVSRRVYVDVQRLPAPPAGRQYQLWALNKGKPVDAGLLTAAAASGERLERMKDVASAQAFAVTLEPVGGSAAPTMPIRAMGTI